MVVNVLGFEGHLSRCDDELALAFSHYVATVHSIVVRDNGTLDTLLGDQLWVTFNAHAACPDMAYTAATVACRLQDALPQALSKFRFTIGLATGHAYVGKVGYARFRNIQCLGGVMKLAGLLAHLRSSEPCAIITEAHMEGRLKFHFKMSPVDLVQLPTLGTHDKSYSTPTVWRCSTLLPSVLACSAQWSRTQGCIGTAVRRRRGDGMASQPRRYRVPGQPLLNRHQVGGSRSPDGLFAQQEREPIRGRPAVRGKRTYGGRPGQRVEEQGTWASQKHSEAGYGRPVDRGVWTANTVKRPPQQPAHPQCANYWAPLTRKRHIPPHSAQPQHTDHWAPRTRKRHRQEHRPQWPTERSDPTQHAKGRTGDCPGPRKGATTRRNVTQGVTPPPPPRPPPPPHPSNV